MAYDRYFYPVHFQDGVCSVTVYDFSSARMYTISTVASITLAAIGFLAVILLDNRRLRKRITDISHWRLQGCSGGSGAEDYGIRSG